MLDLGAMPELRPHSSRAELNAAPDCELILHYISPENHSLLFGKCEMVLAEIL